MGRIAAKRAWVTSALLLTVATVPFVGTTAAAASGTAALSVQDFSFSPATLTVPVGTTVTVTNHGASTHTWSSDPGSGQTWNSGNINPGASFSVTFNTAGTFGYHCNIHTFMTGRIVVTAAPAPTSPPTTANPTTPPTSAAAAPAVVARPTVLPHTGGSKSTVLGAVAVTLTLLGAVLLLAASAAPRRRRRLGR